VTKSLPSPFLRDIASRPSKLGNREGDTDVNRCGGCLPTQAIEVARACLAALGTQLLGLKEQIVEFDRMIMVWHRSNETSKRLNSWGRSATGDGSGRERR
jgi:hypothetical protein